MVHSTCYTETLSAEQHVRPDLSIGELARIADGALLLGTMPPLGGAAEPVGPLVVDSRHTKPGDLFWGLPGNTVNGANCAEHALLNGAQGVVVAGRHVEPWGGRFTVRVPDAFEALVRLGHWARRRFAGTSIALAGGREAAQSSNLLNQFLRGSLSGTCHNFVDSQMVTSVLSVLSWQPHQDYAIVATSAEDTSAQSKISALCDPHILAITSPYKTAHRNAQDDLTAFANALARLLTMVSADTLIVMYGNEPRLRQVAERHSTRFLWVGCHEDCDMVATLVSNEHNSLAFNVGDRRFVFPTCQRRDLPAAVMSIAIGSLLSVTPRRMQAAAESVWLPSSAQPRARGSAIEQAFDTKDQQLYIPYN